MNSSWLQPPGLRPGLLSFARLRGLGGFIRSGARLATTALIFCVLLSGCSSNSEKLTKEIQDASSWISSARLVAKSYADGAVPKAYAHDALDNFNQELQSTGKRVQSISDARTSQASAALQRAQHAIAEINLAMARGDQLSLAQFDLQLDNEQKQLATLVNPESPPPSQP